MSTEGCFELLFKKTTEVSLGSLQFGHHQRAVVARMVMRWWQTASMHRGMVFVLQKKTQTRLKRSIWVLFKRSIRQNRLRWKGKHFIDLGVWNTGVRWSCCKKRNGNKLEIPSLTSTLLSSLSVFNAATLRNGDGNSWFDSSLLCQGWQQNSTKTFWSCLDQGSHFGAASWWHSGPCVPRRPQAWAQARSCWPNWCLPTLSGRINITYKSIWSYQNNQHSHNPSSHVIGHCFQASRLRIYSDFATCITKYVAHVYRHYKITNVEGNKIIIKKNKKQCLFLVGLLWKRGRRKWFSVLSTCNEGSVCLQVFPGKWIFFRKWILRKINFWKVNSEKVFFDVW